MLDVGANFGWYSALFARWVAEGARVHAFAPVPFIHALAVETFALNDMGSRVQLNPFGLGRDSQAIPMYTYTVCHTAMRLPSTSAARTPSLRQPDSSA